MIHKFRNTNLNIPSLRIGFNVCRNCPMLKAGILIIYSERETIRLQVPELLSDCFAESPYLDRSTNPLTLLEQNYTCNIAYLPPKAKVYRIVKWKTFTFRWLCMKILPDGTMFLFKIDPFLASIPNRLVGPSSIHALGPSPAHKYCSMKSLWK